MTGTCNEIVEAIKMSRIATREALNSGIEVIDSLPGQSLGNMATMDSDADVKRFYERDMLHFIHRMSIIAQEHRIKLATGLRRAEEKQNWSVAHRGRFAGLASSTPVEERTRGPPGLCCVVHRCLQHPDAGYDER